MDRSFGRVVTDSRLTIAVTLLVVTWTLSGPGWAALFSVAGILVPLAAVSLLRGTDFVAAAFASSGWQRAVVMCTGVAYGVALAALAALAHAPSELLQAYLAYMVGMAALGLASVMWGSSARVGAIAASAGVAFGLDAQIVGVALTLYALGLAAARARRDSESLTSSGLVGPCLAGLLTWFTCVAF